ncbi:MAG: GxxExxY protein [Anaerolineaceae bacterium]
MNDEDESLKELLGLHDSILYKEEGFKIQGAIFAVNREIGCGFLESVYQECLEQEFTLQGIPFLTHVQYGIQYKGKVINQYYIPDFVCYGKIIVEIKAISETLKEHRAQVLNYLKVSGMRLGFLVNFGHYPKASIERIIF